MSDVQQFQHGGTWVTSYPDTKEKLCFEDILLLPRYSELASRKDPDISSCLGGILKLEAPLISAAMDSITGKEMLVAMDKAGGVGILSRYINFGHEEELIAQVININWAVGQGAKNIGCAIGVRQDAYETASVLLDTGCNVICIDVAHGDHKKVYEALFELEKLKGRYSFVLMAGNVCTRSAAHKFADYGVNAIKVGIGPGAACTTRLVTGFGMPQLSAIQECAEEISDTNSIIIADGGLRTSGDMVKALWAGASACMIGYMLAGTSATPDTEGRKTYRGMSSRSASGRTDIAPEGIEMNMDYRGSTDDKLVEYLNGLKSGLAMGGAKNIHELRECEFVRVSPLCSHESNPKNE